MSNYEFLKSEKATLQDMLQLATNGCFAANSNHAPKRVCIASRAPFCGYAQNTKKRWVRNKCWIILYTY